MNHKTHKYLYLVLILLIAGGSTVAVTGVLYVDSFSADQDFDSIHASLTMQDQTNGTEAPTGADAAGERGFTVGELMRTAGIVAIIVALIILFSIEFFFKDRIQPLNYRMLLLVSLLVLPGLIALSATSTVLETTKSVQSCNTCHIMEPFVDDLMNPESTSLAARHYKNNWISEYQCYTCHTTYGAHGTIAGKRDGFRHWLLYVTRTWDEPITYSGSYPNINCTDCHAGTPQFDTVQSHQALSTELRTDEVACVSCHGPVHPLPGERGDVAENGGNLPNVHSFMSQSDTQELIKMLEAPNE